MSWREEQKICEELNLKTCSMGRCCNAGLIKKLVNEVQMAIYALEAIDHTIAGSIQNNLEVLLEEIKDSND